MPLSRRNMILSTSVLAVGSGIIFGVGAFDGDIDGDQITVEYEDDAGAVLTMESNRAPDDEYITVDEDGDVISIAISPINQNARTIIDDLLVFTNNGTRAIKGIEARLLDESANAVVDVSTGLEEKNLEPGEAATGLSFSINTLEREGLDGEPEIDAIVRISTITE